ncbi:MAG TPA: hypothetical protein VGG03_25185 [Thermoanaerobaculia bacterium]|jgi:hypothetical protein
MNAETRDERLRRLLREADPAADEPRLTLEEVREMRRTVLTAAPEPRRRWLAIPVLSGAAAAVLAAAVALTMWPGPPEPPVPPKETPRVAAVPRTAPAPVPAAPAELATAAAEKAERSRPALELPRSRATKRRPSVHRTPSLPETAPEEPETQQVQFSTPGGTRIIWVLTSDKATE